MVARHDYKTVPPKGDYQLTELGKSLGQAISLLDHWVVDHFYEVAAARSRFRNKRKKSSEPS